MTQIRREDKVISLELAKKIDAEHKRLGIEVDSEWWWAWDEEKCGLYSGNNKPFPEEADSVNAYDCAELGERLPEHYFTQQHDNNWITCWDGGEAQNDYHIGCIAKKGIRLNEAEARGKMYFWLLKNGYIKGGSNDTDKVD